jgi:sigma-B regulation protein RsbU (phosphoserine phosphatase)
MLAGRIQRRFMPRSAPALPGYSFAWEYRPALAVGGDFYDFLDLGAGLVGVAVGDVSGKGISAALYAAKLMSDLRHQAVGRTDPAEILARTNDVLSADDYEGMFATAALIVLDSYSGRLSLSSAGHPLPLVRDHRGCTTTLGRIGDGPLGLDPTLALGLSEYVMEPDEAVIVYTDGLVEATNNRQELYGVRRLTEAVRLSDGTISGIVDSVLIDLQLFAGEQNINDDLTLVGFRRSLPNGESGLRR